MKKPILILFILTLSLRSFVSEEYTGYSMILKNVRKDVVQKAYSQLPKRTSVNILKMCNLMNSEIDNFSLNDYEKVYLVYYWIGYNIKIDCSYSGKYESAVTTYNDGQSTHVGITALFSTMVSNLGLRSNIIEGEMKRTINDYEGKNIFGELVHIWNYVMIDEKYYLFDPTNGIGFCSDEKFKPRFCEVFFGTKPEYFIRSHYPQNSKWQLLNDIVSKEKFESWPLINKFFYLQGFKTVFPDVKNIKINKDLKIKVTYNGTENIFVSCNKFVYIGKTADFYSHKDCTISNGVITVGFNGNEEMDGIIIYSGTKKDEQRDSIVMYNVKK